MIVSILGGGLAGLAAGVRLAERGVRVNVFERRPILGGRAYSVKDTTTGDTLDNGQHLMMGCYHHTLHFLEKIGTRSLLQSQEKMRVDFADTQGRSYRLQCPNLPAPFHLLGGLLGLGSLSFLEKWAMVRMMNAVRTLTEKEIKALDSLTAHQWLTLLSQTERSIQNFWEPLILATLNERPTLVSAEMLAVVLCEALLKNKKDSLMLISSVGLSDLYTGAAQNFIEARGGAVFARRGVKKICVGEKLQVEKMILEDGTEHQSDFYISAMPPDIFLSVIDSEKVKAHPFFSRFQKMDFSPIFSINLWFDRPIMDESFVGLLNSPIHWVFNKGNRVSLVISAARDLIHKNSEELLAISLKALHQALPRSQDAKLLHHRVLKELKATPSFSVGSAKLRPTAQTPIQNLFLAGDWTDTGLPATIEGAVKSGHVAAEAIQKL